MSRAGTGNCSAEGAAETYTMWSVLTVSDVPLVVDRRMNRVGAPTSRCGMWLTGLHTRRRPFSPAACVLLEGHDKRLA